MNCCLERTKWPVGVWVDASNVEGEPTSCQKDTLFWTRFEANDELCDAPLVQLQDQCSVVTDPMSDEDFTSEDTQLHAEFIADGCNYNDTGMEELLDTAYAGCKAEIESESENAESKPVHLDEAAEASSNEANTPTSHPIREGDAQPDHSPGNASSSAGIGVSAVESNCDRSYDKLPDGIISYGMNDGGCFFCGWEKGSSIPLTGETLAETCKQMCDSDPLCIAYEVGRVASLPVYQHIFEGGQTINCCLERTQWPAGVWVDATNVNGAPNNCQKDSLCWTRYETRKENLCGTDIEPRSSPNLCSVVTEPTTFGEDDIQAQIDSIATGCTDGDDELVKKLDVAYAECRAEIFPSKSAGSYKSYSNQAVVASLAGFVSMCSFVW